MIINVENKNNIINIGKNKNKHSIRNSIIIYIDTKSSLKTVENKNNELNEKIIIILVH